MEGILEVNLRKESGLLQGGNRSAEARIGMSLNLSATYKSVSKVAVVDYEARSLSLFLRYDEWV